MGDCTSFVSLVSLSGPSEGWVTAGQRHTGLESGSMICTLVKLERCPWTRSSREVRGAGHQQMLRNYRAWQDSARPSQGTPAWTLRIPFPSSDLSPPDKMYLRHWPFRTWNAQMHKSVTFEKSLKLQFLVKLLWGIQKLLMGKDGAVIFNPFSITW